MASDRPGAVAEIHRKLADAGINVTAANGCVAPNGGFGMILWVKQDRFDLAARTQRQRSFGDFWGFVLVAQGSGEVMVDCGVMASFGPTNSPRMRNCPTSVGASPS